MRAYLPRYEMKSPRDLTDALGILAGQPGVWKPFAGGTDLMVVFEAGHLTHDRFLNIWHLPELKGIHVAADAITLGALTSYAEVQAHPILRAEFPMMGLAASETGAIAIQNRGTLGGNIMNASPAADSPPALLAYDAEIELTSKNGSRWLPYAGFHVAYKKTQARADELLTRVRIPRKGTGANHYYRKVGTRKAQAISKVCFAGWTMGGEFRIALGSVAPIPLRCLKTEQSLRGQKISAPVIARAREVLLQEVTPIDDIRSNGEYRRRVAANLLEEFLCGIGSAN